MQIAIEFVKHSAVSPVVSSSQGKSPAGPISTGSSHQSALQNFPNAGGQWRAAGASAWRRWATDSIRATGTNLNGFFLFIE